MPRSSSNEGGQPSGDPFSVAGEVAVVTGGSLGIGGSRGIGAMIAEGSLARLGH